MVRQITAKELKEKIIVDGGDSLLLLDVREQPEYDYAKIENSLLMPLGQVRDRMGELSEEQEIVVICHHGMRSQQAAEFLEYKGFTRVSNLFGGIDAWSCECDAEVPRY